MPKQETTFQYKWDEIIEMIERKENKKVTKVISADNDGVRLIMEDIK